MIPVLPWRLIGAGALVAAFMLAGWRVNTWHDSHKALRATQARLELEESCGKSSKCAVRVAKAESAATAKQRQVDAEVLSGYQTGLETVAAYAAAHPAPAVRLCRPAGGTSVRVPNSPGTADGSPASGDVPLETSADIGKQLFDLADEADRETLKLKYLQDWNRALSGSK